MIVFVALFATSHCGSEEQCSRRKLVGYISDPGAIESLRGCLTGFDPSLSDDGNNLLFEAAGRGNKEAVRLLIKHGANANVAGSGGLVPLHDAVIDKYMGPDVIYALLDGGADPNKADPSGATVMQWALLAQPVEVLERLLEAGGDLRLRDHLGRDAVSFVLEEHDGEDAEKALVVQWAKDVLSEQKRVAGQK
jgi:ankyrin repeat protein